MTRYWKEIKGYENKYKISNYGEVVSLPRFKNNHSKLQEVPMKQIKPYINKKNGYVYVYLCNKVAKLFDTTGENIRQILIRNNIERN